MMIATSIAFIFLGLTGFFLQRRDDNRFQEFLSLLVLTVIATSFLDFLGGESKGSVFILLGIAALNFVASQIKFLQARGARILLPILSFAIYFLLLNGEIILFTEKEYPLINKFLVLGVLLSVFGYEIADLKIQIMKKWIKDLKEKEVKKALVILFLGLGVFLSVFQSGLLGLLVVAAAFVSTTFYVKKGLSGVVAMVLALVMVPVLLLQSDYTEVDLMGGDVLGGIVLGAFSIYLIQSLWQSKGVKLWLLIAAHFMVAVLAFGLLYNHMIHHNMGGMDAFVAIVIGAGLVLGVIGKAYTGITVLSLLFAGGLLIPPLMVNEEAQAYMQDSLIGESSEGSTDKEVEVELKSVAFSDIIGKYNVTEESKVSFFLGEKGETKGAFKQFGGEIEIAETPEKSVFKIELKMEHFTTFNKYRDESLFGEEYFKADQFPVMKFEGSKLESTGDDEYSILGKFTMLGVTKELPVSAKCVEVDGNFVLTGSGEIDRTEFGMSPSAQEGNVVSFTYEVKLK